MRAGTFQRSKPEARRPRSTPAPAFQEELGSNAEYRPIYLRGLAYLRAGDGVHAIAEVQRSAPRLRAFFGIWKNADADAPILVQARSEYAKLGAPSP